MRLWSGSTICTLISRANLFVHRFDSNAHHRKLWSSCHFFLASSRTPSLLNHISLSQFSFISLLYNSFDNVITSKGYNIPPVLTLALSEKLYLYPYHKPTYQNMFMMMYIYLIVHEIFVDFECKLAHKNISVKSHTLCHETP